MTDRKADRHGWLRGALADKGLQQQDVAKRWGVDNAVVSRFIRTGTPELTWDRAMALSEMLGMSLDELRLRLSEGIAPRRKGAATAGAPATHAGGKDEALAQLREAVAKARTACPDATIDVSISYKREEKL